MQDLKKYVLGFCLIFVLAELTNAQNDPCAAFPAPCGPNSRCTVINNLAQCECLDNFIGQPPICRHECGVAAECLDSLACINNRCVAACPGVCGTNSQCLVVDHTPACVCLAGFTGNPHRDCIPIADGYNPSFFLTPP